MANYLSWDVYNLVDSPLCTARQERHAKDKRTKRIVDMCTTKTFTSTFPPFLCATSLHTGHSYFHITYEIDHSLKALLTRPRFDLRFGQFDHNFTIHSSLMKKVIKNINVFRSFVKLRILCQFDRNFIIYVQDNFLMTLILKIN